MKRFLSLFILIFGVVLLAGCGKKGPVTFEGKNEIYVRFGDPNFDMKAGLTAVDEAKGDVLAKVEADKEVNVNEEGEYIVTFSVKASNGELFTHTVKFIVKKLELQGAGDTKVVLGAYQFDPLNGVFVIDPVDGRITKANRVQADIQVSIKLEGSDEELEAVDTKTLGEYIITYTISYMGSTAIIERRVSIVEEILWIGVGETEIEVGDTFVPLQGVRASQPIKDDEGNPTTRNISQFVRVVSNTIDNAKPGSYEVVYKIIDPTLFDPEDPNYDPTDHTKDPIPAVYLQENGEDVSVTRIVNVVNKIILMGVGNTSVTRDKTFDPMAGVSAKDSVGTIDASKISVDGVVDTTKEGTYELTYTVTGAFNTVLTVTRTITVTKPITGKIDIIFMSGNPSENDPFSPTYTGGHAEDKQRLQREVEERYNVTVKYVPYTDNAAWGDSRVNAMIQSVIDGKPLADVYYHVSSDWIPRLANGGAISAVDEFIAPGAHGEDMPESARKATTYAKKVYGFSTGGLGLEAGFYYNADIVNRLGLQNPTQLYLDGVWTWSKFKAWTLQAKAALGEGESVLGGHVGVYAENLVPLNGGDFINEERGKVVFRNQQALETYAFIKELYDAQLFEAEPAYDAGSQDWRSGKVIFHPGHFWFITADNRWGGKGDNKVINFELGFVPYPVSDSYSGPYRSPVYGPSFPVMADGISQERKELVFKVWWDLQRKVPKEQAELEFRALLAERFAKEIYIQAYLSVRDSAYRSVINGLGISQWGTGSYLSAVNVGIREGTYSNLLREIEPAYQDALNRYLAA